MDDIIECPKHNGRFNYKTGEAKGAPVCVNLKTYPVKVEAGSVFISASLKDLAMSHIVIIGAGECGARAAFALREKGFDGRITLVGAEEHLPYERPPLSKDALLHGRCAEAGLATAARYAEAGIEVLTGVERREHRSGRENRTALQRRQPDL